MAMRRSAALLGLAVALVAAEPAAATFPGRNGEIVLTQEDGGKYSNQQIGLLRFAPRLGSPQRHEVCSVGQYVSPLFCRQLGEPAYAPDGSQFAAIANEATFSQVDAWALWLLTPDGRRISSQPLRSGYSEVRWAPDASELLATRFLEPADGRPPEERRTGVFVLGLDGSERELLADASEPDWCADGRVILVQYGEIRVIEPDGRVRRLTRQGSSAPSCAPNSQRVAFTRRGAVWTIPLAGGRARRLTRGFAPVWSPDGKQLGYLRKRRDPSSQTLDTFVYRIGLRRLRVRAVSENFVMTDDPYSDAWAFGPEWRPLPPRP
jgi:dipeptidyl aminopeptidase/acylaminoacyl peptidase